MRLSDLAALLGTSVAEAPEGLHVSGVSLDSRAVLPGDIFAALPGHATHGSRFAEDAVSLGAVAILTDPSGTTTCSALGVPVLVVDDPRGWLGGVAALVYGFPGSQMQLIGITGTNGKTTVSAMVESGLRAAGRTTGMIGTVGVRIVDRTFDGPRTTPEATDLHALLGVMRDEGVTSVVMEVSSIAIDEHRVDGVIYDIAAFTNLSQDHLDYHGTMESYFAAKATLFDPTRTRRAVIGVDDEWGRRLADGCTVDTDTWSAAGPNADWNIVEAEGAHVILGPGGERQPVVVALAGAFNLANALCAYVILRRAGVDPDAAAAGISTATVPGRMQRVGEMSDVIGIVDYAHSPDAIERVLESVRDGSTRVIVVLGAGGDRDTTKRPQMGAIAARLSDVLIITDDNPRSEDPELIRAAIRSGAQGIDSDARADILEEGDRAVAITVAVARAKAGDVVVVLGKGHELGQEAAGVMTPFDDVTVLREALAARASR
ncbi:MAG: UDP-N-acetylmuramoyl-L-alanyl-D-glutamate--2,6-diaminopimelate ligase [bacterium]|nr:UDP-N-acetylmuramoyl-L-alanyl-D-glutamate--2,6-diaminopimelate ligase [bacterium]